MRNTKSRPKTRLDKAIMLLLNNTWQESQFWNRIFETEFEKIDIEEVREVLDG
jgi:hypothetical protein